MKRCLPVVMLMLASIIPLRAESPPPDEAPALSNEFLFLVMRHLYRWHLDETMLLAVEKSPDVEFLLRALTPELDPGDRSQYLELLVPQVSYRVVLKKALYDVPEMEMEISNADFRVIKAEKYDEPPTGPEAYRRITLSNKEMLDYLFRMRSVRDYPDDELMDRMRKALREQYALQPGEKVEGPQTVYVAPISKVSNNLWVFWENAGKIIRFSSDTDMTSKAFWNYEKLGVRMYDLDKDVVVSLAEYPGSNAYVTRDWAARVLYNCVVFGKRMTIMPVAEAEGSSQAPAPSAP